MRSITSEMLTALSDGNVIPVIFVELMFDSGAVRVHSAVGTYMIDGNPFLGVGSLGKISAIEESVELKSYGIKLELSGIPNDYVSIVLDSSEHCQGRPVRMWLGLLTPSYTLIQDAVLVFIGRMDSAEVIVETQGTVIITAENHLIDWDRPRIRRYNDADQQSEYPGDTGMRFVERVANKTIFWGKTKTV